MKYIPRTRGTKAWREEINWWCVEEKKQLTTRHMIKAVKWNVWLLWQHSPARALRRSLRWCRSSGWWVWGRIRPRSRRWASAAASTACRGNVGGSERRRQPGSWPGPWPGTPAASTAETGRSKVKSHHLRSLKLALPPCSQWHTDASHISYKDITFSVSFTCCTYLTHKSCND